MSYSDSFPSSAPVFQANFSSNGGRIDPRMTFSRPDSPIDTNKAAASAVHFWSNEKHLSSENLLLDSKTGTANWTEAASGSASTPTITANHAASPDGTASQATRVQLNLNGATDTSSNSRYNQSINLPSGNSVTFSVWLKSTDGASSYEIQVYQADGNAAAATVTGSWQKFTTTATAAASAAFGIRVRGGQSPTNADTADVLMWGANVSTTGETVLNETTTQIHREYAPTLKSVATAGQPRFEYDPADGQSMGILLESQSTNLLNYSEEFDNAYWSKYNTPVTANAGVAPSGQLVADLLVAASTGSSTNHYLAKAISFTSGTTYTLSVYVKAAGYTKFNMRAGNPATWGVSTTFTLTGSGSASVISGSGQIQSCGNGWFRCSVTETAASTSATNILLGLVDNSGNLSFDGDDYSGVLLWGAQMEQASFASSYIKVEGSTATRALESLSMTDSSLFGTGSGSVVVEAGPVNGTFYPTLFDLTDTTTSNRVLLQSGGTGTPTSLTVAADGNASVGVVSEAVTMSDRKFAISYDTNSFKLVNNGGAVSEDTSGQLPQQLSKLNIGTDNGGGGPLNGHIKRIAVYGEALSDTNLISLTS